MNQYSVTKFPALAKTGLERGTRKGFDTLGCAQALAQVRGDALVAGDAQRAEVFQRALAAAFDHRHDVIGVPGRA